MISRALLLFALLSTPAGAQEFDLRSEALKKIVRDTAATQYATVVQAPPTVSPAPEPGNLIRYVPPEKPAERRKPAAPRVQPQPKSEGFLSQLVEILVDEALDAALGGGSRYSGAPTFDRWLRCEGRAPLKTTQMGYDTCPNKGQQLSPIGP